jgi:hypothetical protein
VLLRVSEGTGWRLECLWGSVGCGEVLWAGAEECGRWEAGAVTVCLLLSYL